MTTHTAEKDIQTVGVAAAARTLNVSESYIQYLTNVGTLACTREKRNGRRRFTAADLRAFQKRRRRRAHPNSTVERRA